MKFTRYNHTLHFERCIEMFNSNVPKYFAPSEEDEFKEWLRKHEEEPYWVVETEEGELVGCGGIYFAEEHTKSKAEFPNEVGFAWGMVDNPYHKKGYGKALSLFRLNYLKENHPKRPIVLRTSQHTYGFFEKLGFSTLEYIKDGWEPGMDKVIMVYQK